MSLATIVPVGIGGAQAAVSTAAQLANLAAGFAPTRVGLDIITKLAKDIKGFEFDYIGEERIEAKTEITDHYNASNQFMQDHCSVRPSIITMRGYVAENALNKNRILPFLTAALSALTPITPYLGTYSPGSAAAMADAVSQTEQVIQQLARVQAIYGAAQKLLQTVGKLPGAPSKVQQAYNALDDMRIGGTTFAVVTPWATFGETLANGSQPHGPMMIESLVMVAPELTRGWADIVVTLKEIRVAPSIMPAVMDNARGGGPLTANGNVSATGRA